MPAISAALEVEAEVLERVDEVDASSSTPSPSIFTGGIAAAAATLVFRAIAFSLRVPARLHGFPAHRAECRFSPAAVPKIEPLP
jgi:hypothetical protein